jgi:hypothetical protein
MRCQASWTPLCRVLQTVQVYGYPGVVTPRGALVTFTIFSTTPHLEGTRVGRTERRTAGFYTPIYTDAFVQGVLQYVVEADYETELTEARAH